jgi:hypothetical protein
MRQAILASFYVSEWVDVFHGNWSGDFSRRIEEGD